jgi:membrane associated rhomboid family serine protease
MMRFSEQQYRKKILPGKKDNSLITLVGICLILFVSFAFVKAIWYFNYPDKQVAQTLFSNNVFSLFTLPADLAKIAERPWAIITSMFLAGNNDFWKVFPNMFWLWAFGFILQDLTGGKKIIPVFFYGALGGAIAFVLAYNYIPSLQSQLPNATLGGIPCGVMAIAVVTTLVSPGYRLFPMIAGGIPLWVLTGFYLISDFATLSISDTGTLLTHLGAAFTGILFILFLRRGYDWSEWMNNFFEWVGNLFEPGRPQKGADPVKQLYYKSATTPYVKTPKVTQERVDEILDKISEHGYGQLTEEEKDILRRASKDGI